MQGADTTVQTLLALDIGEARIGVALANTVARIAHPVGVVQRSGEVTNEMAALCKREHVDKVILGLPRGLQGQDTPQTQAVRVFGDELMRQLGLPYAWQDEAATSVQAEAELRHRKKPYTKGDIDALAATYILEDYLHETV